METRRRREADVNFLPIVLKCDKQAKFEVNNDDVDAFDGLTGRCHAT